MSESLSPQTFAADAPLRAADHALLELRRVGLGLLAGLARWAKDRAEAEPIRRLVHECRAELASLAGAPLSPDLALPLDVERRKAAEHAARRLETTLRAGVVTPLCALIGIAELQAFELDVLLCAALAEESSAWGALFACAADNPAIRRPTVHLALSFASERIARGDALRQLAEGRLLSLGLVRLEPREAPLADRTIVVGSETWLALKGVDAVEPILAPHILPAEDDEPVASDRETLAGLARRFCDDGQGRAVITGPPGSGRAEAARWVAEQVGCALTAVALPPAAPAELVAAAVRHAVLRNAGLLFVADAPPGEPVSLDLVAPPRLLAFVAMPERADLRSAAFRAAPRLHLRAPGVRAREAFWARAVEKHGAPQLDAAALARRYRVPRREIEAIVGEAVRGAAILRRPTSVGDVEAAARQRFAGRLSGLTGRRVPRAGWDDLILPAHSKAEIADIVARVRHRDQVFEEWGVDAKGARQSGVVALFVGASGTGKTLAAEVVASRLSVDLYCVDLSQVVSKYIGETEKNLARVFEAAEDAAAVLFFDEADGVFGKRTETHNAHDRYANLEASYLLARLETFRGLCVLASNFQKNIDAAFMRRMDFVVEFAEPDEPSRAALWRRHLACSAEIAPDVDPERLARLFAVSGAQIRNAVVTAAFRAAERGGRIASRDLEDAMRREYQKTGRAFPSLPESHSR